MVKEKRGEKEVNAVHMFEKNDTRGNEEINLLRYKPYFPLFSYFRLIFSYYFLIFLYFIFFLFGFHIFLFFQFFFPYFSDFFGFSCIN